MPTTERAEPQPHACQPDLAARLFSRPFFMTRPAMGQVVSPANLVTTGPSSSTDTAATRGRCQGNAPLPNLPSPLPLSCPSPSSAPAPTAPIQPTHGVWHDTALIVSSRLFFLVGFWVGANNHLFWDMGNLICSGRHSSQVLLGPQTFCSIP